MDFAETSSSLSLNDNNVEASIFPRSLEELKKPGRKKYFPTSSRFTEPSSSSSYFEGNKIYNVDVEDATHILRKIEFAAFQAVATAFRTQGPLTPYKELILEHLRFALFIREHDFIQIIQEIADDTFLQKTCKTLNKSSSCSAQWRALSFPVHTPTNAYIRRSGPNESRIKLLTTIGCHNVSVKELDVATAKLSNLKKEQYIPQQLRRVLADSELSAGRVDIEEFDITEEEIQRDFVDYEKEKERIAKEIEEEERGRNGRSRRGKKRKITIPRFQNQTLRAQARVVVKDVEVNNEKKKRTDEDVPDEEEQCQAEAEMMKMIEDQARGIVPPPPPPPVITASVVIEAKKSTTVSPQKVVQKTKVKRKSKDTKEFPSSKETTKYHPSTSTPSSSHHQQPPLAPFIIVPEHLPPPKPLIITAKPPPQSSSNEYFHHPKNNNRSEEQRAMDEDLVLVKTAQAMIEDLENTLEPENGLTSSGKKRKQKHDGTPKRRGRKPAESKDNPITCARIVPFQFEGNSTDPNKPPRGNPDKKVKKQINDLKSPPIPATNGINYEKPATSPPTISSSSSSQLRLPMIPTCGTPKTAIIPVSPATIVIRPRNNASTSTSPSTSVATNVVVNEISPAKRMRFSSETSSSQTTVVSGTIATDPSRVFPVIRQTGRPTLFRPPNVVFPRSANVLNNGTARYAIPFTTQSSGNPTRPYYGNPSFNNRPTVSRERPQLHTFSRPTTSVIRLVTTDIKTEESATAVAGSIITNGMRSRSIDESITVSKTELKEDEPPLSNGIIINQESVNTAASNIVSSLPLNSSMSQNIQFSTSFPSTISSSTLSSSDNNNTVAGGTTQMISLRPHFPLSSTNIQQQNSTSTTTMINLQAMTYSTKPSTTSLYQVVNATPTFMQNISPQQLVQTAIPVMLHTVGTSNFTTTSTFPTQQPSSSSTPTMINLSMKQSGIKSNKEKVVQKSNGSQRSSSLKDIPLPENDDDAIDMNSSYSSNESFEIPPPPPPPPEDEGQGQSSSSILETTVPPEDPSHLSEPSHHRTKMHHLQEQRQQQQSEPEVVINGVDPHISASHQSMVNKNHSSSSYHFATAVAAPIPLPIPIPSSLSPSNSDANSLFNLLPVEESQNLLLNVSQSNATTPASSSSSTTTITPTNT
uniref:ENT domain-containing protein n=1 Tax=Panagrolaimus sp. ES5 TaxID=591445 RepID=A0AC34FTD1_9BILA